MTQTTDWQAFSQTVNFRHQAYINGQYQDAVSGETFASINPATEQVLADVAACDAADIDMAVANAREVYRSGVWSQMAPAERKRILLKVADVMEQHSDELALLDTLDMGKSIQQPLSFDVPDAIDCFRWSAECIDKVYGEIAPTSNELLGLITRNPIGVIGAITPWNYPLLMACWKLAPALAAGNSVVLKPSEKASLSLLRLAELAVEAGLPKGVLNVAPGFGHTAGKALALHPQVDSLAFTGSTRVAGMLMEYAGQSNLKQVWIEAGGKSPVLVFDDCEDLQAAAATVAAGIFSNQGEVCIAGSRLYLQKSIKEAFLAALVDAAQEYLPGDPLDPDVTMGPMVDKAQLDTVAQYIQSAVDEGARVICGGLPQYREGKGFYARPTVITDIHNQMKFVQEEIFGPVLAVGEFESEAEAIALANDNQYGLASCIWSDNLSRVHRVSRQIEAGMVWVNTWGDGDQTMPFGGIKASGNARDKSLHALEKYTELKSVWINLKGAE
ncbi:MAG: aldehyde dehydrogenase [Candidatus Pelagadaptatus aseana]|uniref:aldehyde dehydrogenase n=1 Tax=Candidatus Pelagadaptatus aseana TaxID=3120508 RepID=UPI0039B2F81E